MGRERKLSENCTVSLLGRCVTMGKDHVTRRGLIIHEFRKSSLGNRVLVSLTAITCTDQKEIMSLTALLNFVLHSLQVGFTRHSSI